MALPESPADVGPSGQTNGPFPVTWAGHQFRDRTDSA